MIEYKFILYEVGIFNLHDDDFDDYIVGFEIIKDYNREDSFYLPLITNPKCIELDEGRPYMRSCDIHVTTQQELLNKNANCTFVNELNLDVAFKLSDGTYYTNGQRENITGILGINDWVVM